MSSSNAQEQQRQAEDFGWTVVAALIVLAVVVLLLWPLGRLPLAIDVARSFGLFYLVVWAAAAVLGTIQQRFRINLYDRGDLFLLSNGALSGFLVTGWAAWTALVVRGSAAGAPLWTATILYAAGLLTIHAAYSVVSAFYPGTFYRYTNLPLAAAAFVLFSFWPAAARFLFGWFFRRF